jgi:hypothetical protein
MKEEVRERLGRLLLWLVVIALTVFGSWLLSKVLPATVVEKRTERPVPLPQ